MKMAARSATLLAFLASAGLLPAADAVRRLRAEPAKSRSPSAASLQDQRRGLAARRQRRAPPDVAEGLSGSCKKELMALQVNKSKLMAAQACESKSNNTKRAVQALQRANVSAATSAAADTFYQCAGISRNCSEEVAPKIVLAIRLSGVAVSQKCAMKASAHSKPKGQSAQEAEVCQQNTTSNMMKHLAARDLQGCLVVAEHGLHMCHGIQPPCDFQLAPILVANVMAAAAAGSGPRQQVTEVLLAGMHTAEEIAEEMVEELGVGLAGGPGLDGAGGAEARNQNASKTDALPKPTPKSTAANRSTVDKKAISVFTLAQHVQHASLHF